MNAVNLEILFKHIDDLLAANNPEIGLPLIDIYDHCAAELGLPTFMERI